MSKIKSKIKSRCILFDLDGTLIDTTLLGFDKIQTILEQMRLPSVEENFLRKIWGEPFPNIAHLVCEEVGGHDRVQEFLNRELQLPIRYKVNLFLLQDLWSLRSAGNTLGLITSRSNDSIKALTLTVGLDVSMFNYLVTPDNCRYVKPDPRVFDDIPGIGNHDEIYYFGDTVCYDYVAAANSPLPVNFIGVVSGISTHSDFLRVGVVETVDGVNALGHCLQRMFLNNNFKFGKGASNSPHLNKNFS